MSSTTGPSPPELALSPDEIALVRRLVRARTVNRWRGVPPFIADFDDLQQAALEVVLRKWGRRDPKTPLTAWIHLTAESALTDEVRRLLGRERRPLNRSLDAPIYLDDSGEIALVDTLEADRSDDPYDIDPIRQRDIESAVRGLPLFHQSLLHLRYEEHLTFRAIGDMLGVTESRAFQLCADARGWLKRDLELLRVDLS